MNFNENRLRGSGGMEQTQNSRVNPLTLTCDLQSGSCALHTVSLRGTFD